MPQNLPIDFSSDEKLSPDTKIQGYISVKGSKSVFNASPKTIPTASTEYKAEPEHMEIVRVYLSQNDNAINPQPRNNGDLEPQLNEKFDFDIIAESPLGFAVSGSISSFEKLTEASIFSREILLHSELDRDKYVTHLDIEGVGQSKTVGVGAPPPELTTNDPRTLIDGIIIQRPQVRLGIYPSPIPPRVSRYHLNVPNDIALGCSALEAHSNGVFGDGIRVAMPDSGHYLHPFFVAHKYNIEAAITVIPDTDPRKDFVGHGTGESANLFAIAPHVELIPIRISDDEGKFVGALSGFMKAKTLLPKPHIISCSWGWDRPFPLIKNGEFEEPDEYEKAIALEIMDAVEQGIIVVFAAGNGSFSIEPQIPGVISAGGVYLSEDLTLEASNYSTGYESPWYKDTIVPTVSGLVGQRPKGQYIMLPVPPGSEIDLRSGFSIVENIVNQDNQDSDLTDGWALFSGTSASAPQIAGVAALILSKYPGLSPADVKDAIMNSATDISSGSNHPNFNKTAIKGKPDEATGHGLVHAYKALLEASIIYQNRFDQKLHNADEDDLSEKIPLVIRDYSVPLTIFDEDDRLDWYEMSRDMQQLSSAVAAIVNEKDIPFSNNLYNLNISETLESYIQRIKDRPLCPNVLKKIRSQPTAADGTAFLIHERLILTNFHNINPKRNEQNQGIDREEIIRSGNYDISDTKFIFNYIMKGENQPVSSFTKDQVYSARKVIAFGCSTFIPSRADWALIELDKTVDDSITPLVYLRDQRQLELTTKRQSKLMMLGFPDGTPVKIVTEGMVTSYPFFPKKDIFSADLDSFGGNSGSPVFNADKNVVGIVFGGSFKDYKNLNADDPESCIIPEIKEGNLGRRGTMIQRLDNIFPAIDTYIQKL